VFREPFDIEMPCHNAAERVVVGKVLQALCEVRARVAPASNLDRVRTHLQIDEAALAGDDANLTKRSSFSVEDFRRWRGETNGRGGFQADEACYDSKRVRRAVQAMPPSRVADPYAPGSGPVPIAIVVRLPQGA
jgi:hypothetical protein